MCLLEKYPQLNEKTVLKQFAREGGGPVPTALVVLQKLGLNTAYIGKVGADDEGQFLITALQQHGVNTDFVFSDPECDTPMAIVMVDEPSGKRTIILNRTETTDIILTKPALDRISNGRLLLVDGWEHEATIAAAERAHQHGIPVAADYGSLRPDMEHLLSVTDYPIVSENFCHQFFGKITPEKAAEKLLNWGATVAIVTCGIRGSFAASPQETRHQPAFEVPVVDTTGAGDVYHGGFLFGLLKNWSLAESMRFASAVAALKCRALGGRAGIPELAEVKQFLKRQNSQ